MELRRLLCLYSFLFRLQGLSKGSFLLLVAPLERKARETRVFLPFWWLVTGLGLGNVAEVTIARLLTTILRRWLTVARVEGVLWFLLGGKLVHELTVATFLRICIDPLFEVPFKIYRMKRSNRTYEVPVPFRAANQVIRFVFTSVWSHVWQSASHHRRLDTATYEYWGLAIAPNFTATLHALLAHIDLALDNRGFLQFRWKGLNLAQVRGTP